MSGITDESKLEEFAKHMEEYKIEKEKGNDEEARDLLFKAQEIYLQIKEEEKLKEEDEKRGAI